MQPSHPFPVSSRIRLHFLIFLAVILAVPAAQSATCYFTPAIDSATAAASRSKSPAFREFYQSSPPLWRYYKGNRRFNSSSDYYYYDWTPWSWSYFYGADWAYRSTYVTEVYNPATSSVSYYDWDGSGGSGWYWVYDVEYYSGDCYTYWSSPYQWSCYDCCASPDYISGGWTSYSSSPTYQSEHYGYSSSGTYWYGEDYTSYYEDSGQELSDEFTTSELRSLVSGILASASWSSWSSGGASASYLLSTDETSLSMQKMRYRFRFSTFPGVYYTVTWKERSTGQPDIPYSTSITGTGGEVFVGPYEVAAPPINATTSIVDYQVSYFSPWQASTLNSHPSLSISASSPGTRGMGSPVSVTANVSTSPGTKTRWDGCGNSETLPQWLSSPSVSWWVTGVSASPSSGSGATASFTPQSLGTCVVNFSASATTTDPEAAYSSSTSASFQVVLGATVRIARPRSGSNIP